MDVKVDHQAIGAGHIRGKLVFEYLRTGLLSLPVEFREAAQEKAIKPAAYLEMNTMLKDSRTAESEFKDLSGALRKTFRVVRLRFGARGGRGTVGYGAYVGGRTAAQAKLINYGHRKWLWGKRTREKTKPRPFATKHVGKIDSQLIAEMDKGMRRAAPEAANRAIARARANPQGWRMLL